MGGFLFEIMIWTNCFDLLERDFLGKMVVTDVMMEVLVEVVVVGAVDVVRAGFFVFFMRGCLGDIMGVRVVIEVVVGVVEVVCSNRGEGVVSSGENVSVTSGGARWGDCCRFPNGIFGEHWEDLPYRPSFTFDMGDVFL